jgi:hypothetical protein
MTFFHLYNPLGENNEDIHMHATGEGGAGAEFFLFAIIHILIGLALIYFYRILPKVLIDLHLRS